MSDARILSRTWDAFGDRVDAGQRLAEALRDLALIDPVILGVPRGGVVVAREVANALDADLDIVLAGKLRAPVNPELAIGAVAETGRPFINHEIASAVGADQAYIEAETERRRRELADRARQYRPHRPKVPLAGRSAMIIDDGVATGATVQAAIWAVRGQDPAEVIVALPVGPEESVRALAEDSDHLICLNCPPDFSAVGQFYELFGQVDDSRVAQILSEAAGSGRVK